MNLVVAIHLITVLPALCLGFTNLLMEKGTLLHKYVGRVWVVLMLITAMISFFITSNGAYSWIHILSAFTIICIFVGIAGIRLKNKRLHRGCMVGAFCGSLTAGIFATIVPGRLVYEFLLGVCGCASMAGV